MSSMASQKMCMHAGLQVAISKQVFSVFRNSDESFLVYTVFCGPISGK